MSVDMTDARLDYADALFGDVVIRHRTATPPVADIQITGQFKARQLQGQSNEAIPTPIGAYLFKCPVGSDIIEQDVLKFGGKKFNVVFAPPVSATDLYQTIGMDAL